MMGRRKNSRQQRVQTASRSENVTRQTRQPAKQSHKNKPSTAAAARNDAAQANRRVSRREAFTLLKNVMDDLTQVNRHRKAAKMNESNYNRGPGGGPKDANGKSSRAYEKEYGEFGSFDPPNVDTDDATAIAIAASAAVSPQDEPKIADWTDEAGGDWTPIEAKEPSEPPPAEPAPPDMAIAVRVFPGDKNRELPQEVEVIYDDLVYQEIMTYVRETDVEVQGFGKVVVEVRPSNDVKKADKLIFRVVSTILPKQVGQAAETDIDALDLAIEDSATEHLPGELRCWWHSHVRMATKWSGTDVQNMMDQCQAGYFVSTVFNQLGEQRTAIIFRGEIQGVSVPLILDEIPMSVERFIDGRLVAKWKAKVKDKVTKKYGGSMTSYNSYGKTDNFGGETPVGHQYPYQKFMGPGVVPGGDSSVARRTTVAQDSARSNRQKPFDFPVRGQKFTADELIDWTLETAVKLGFDKDEAVDWASTCEDLIHSRQYTLDALRTVISDRMQHEARKLPATPKTSEQPLETD